MSFLLPGHDDVQLCPDGENLIVTHANLRKYSLAASWVWRNSVGFHGVFFGR